MYIFPVKVLGYEEAHDLHRDGANMTDESTRPPGDVIPPSVPAAAVAELTRKDTTQLEAR